MLIEIQKDQQALILKRPGIGIDFRMVFQQQSIFPVDNDRMPAAPVGPAAPAGPAGDSVIIGLSK